MSDELPSKRLLAAAGEQAFHVADGRAGKKATNYTVVNASQKRAKPWRLKLICPIHTARQTRQDSALCVVSGGLN